MRRTLAYRMEGDGVVPLGSLDTAPDWSDVWDIRKRRIARDVLPDGRVVSTVFLVVDHSYDEDGPPLLFETMVFPSESDCAELHCTRYCCRRRAKLGHDNIAEALRENGDVIEYSEAICPECRG